MGQFEMVDTPRDSLRILEAGLQDHEQPCDTDALNPLWYIVIIVTVVFLLFLGRTAWMWKCQMSLPSSALNSGAPESMELRSDSSHHNIQSEELEKLRVPRSEKQIGLSYWFSVPVALLPMTLLHH